MEKRLNPSLVEQNQVNMFKILFSLNRVFEKGYLSTGDPPSMSGLFWQNI